MGEAARDGLTTLQDENGCLDEPGITGSGSADAEKASEDEVIKTLRELGLGISATAVENGPDRIVAWQLLGHCFERLGDARQSRQCYARAAARLVTSTRPQPPIEPIPFAVLGPDRTGTDN